MAFLGANVERYFIEVLTADEQLHLVRMEGKEGVSELYQFNVELVCDDSELPIEEYIGQDAVITLLDNDLEGGEQARYMHGIVGQMEIGQLGVSQTTYYLTVVPKIWPLTFRRNNRIFQHLTVADIISAVLTDAGIQAEEFRFELNSELPQRLYTVQYAETDMQFISRLLEDEGIHYYFEHMQDLHVLVMSDSSNTNPAITPDAQLDYFHDAQGTVRQQHIFDFKYLESVKSSKVSIRDYNFKKPRMQLKEQLSCDSPTELEVYDYPGLFKEAERGKNYAKLRLEALNHYRKRATVASDVNTVTPGYSFTLSGHERDTLNVEYLITQIAHKCAQTQVLEVGATEEGTQYSNDFNCIPFDVPFRPMRNTPRPNIHGTQTATVTGPDGEELYTDEYGRIKVQFHWDREGEFNEASSCWIRVSQPAAGAGFGGFFLPRIGEEVIVDFLEGDPDKPLVIGRVYHGVNRPPYSLPAEKSKSTIKTNSTKGGKGFNELRFEDKKGEEQIFIHGEKDLDERVKHDYRDWIGHDRDQMTINDSSEEIQGNTFAKTIGDEIIEVEGNSDRTFESNVTQKTEGNEHYTVADQHIMQINGDDHLKVANAQNVKIGTKLSLTAGSAIHHKAGNNIILDAGSEMRLRAGGSFVTLGASGVAVSGAAINIVGGTVNLVAGTININQGGSAGSAPPAAPTAASLPNLPAVPIAPQVAEEGLQPSVMDTRAPFCEPCEKAKRKAKQ